MSSLGSGKLTLTVSSPASALSGTSLLSLAKLSGSGLTLSCTSGSSCTVVCARSKLTLF
jgi:hypothetical protein